MNGFRVKNLVAISIVLIFVCCVETVCLLYRWTEYGDFCFLSQEHSESDVIRHFGGGPFVVYESGDVLPQQGWRVPTRPITNKLLIFDRSTALRYYIYIDKDGQVECFYAYRS